MSWIRTALGKRIDFLNPDPEEIDIRDIAIALGRNHRFGGHSPLKIAQHILEVSTGMMHEVGNGETHISKDMANAGLVGLLHDFPEYAVLDCMTPLKHLLNPSYEEIEDRLLEVMLLKWDLTDAYDAHHDLMKKHDKDCVIQEAHRYKLDGWIINDDGEYQKVPNEWTPETYEITYSDAVYPEQAITPALRTAFIKLMIISGRYHLLDDGLKKQFDTMTTLRQTTVEELAVTTTIMPPLLLKGPSYF